jgi:hypothetical protein
LKREFIWSEDIISQKLFDVSDFKGLKLCAFWRTVEALSVDGNFRCDHLLSPERMIAGRASTVTDADVSFAPGACGVNDGLTADWAVDWHLCFRGVNGRGMDQPQQLPCISASRGFLFAGSPACCGYSCVVVTGASLKTAWLMNALTVWSSILWPTRTPELVISSYLPGKN